MNLSLLSVLVLFALSPALSAQVLDQEQNSDTTCMAGYSQTDLAQSFRPSFDNVAGCGIFLRAATGVAETVTVELWDALPNQGGTMLASGTTLGSPGTWADVFWGSVSVTAGNTYYMVFYANGTSLCFAGDTSNPYPSGQVYANSGFGSFPNFDYTFRTYSNDKPALAISTPHAGGYMNIQVTSLSAGAEIVLVISTLGPGPTATPFGNIEVSAPFRLSPRFPENGGSFHWTSTVPMGAAGQTFYVQVVEFEEGGTTDLSNAIAVFVN